MSKVRMFRLLAAMMLTLALATTGFAWPPDGKGKPGSEEPPPEPPPLPPIEYVPTFFSAPAGTDRATLNDYNETGIAVGRCLTPDGDEHGWIYDVDSMTGVAVDLNDLDISGLDNGWYIACASGVSNNGLVVGYVLPEDGPAGRTGFVLDLVTMVIHPLPDAAWTDTYARKVNDNGDLLGVIFDGEKWYAYLFNPGLRGTPDVEAELIDIPLPYATSIALNNPPPGVPTTVVGYEDGGGFFQFTRGETVVFRDDITPAAWKLVINDFADFAGVAWVETVVPVNRKKTTTITERALWRDTGAVETLVKFGEDGRGVNVTGLNNSGTVYFWSWDDPSNIRIYHDGYGDLQLADLIPNVGQFLNTDAYRRINTVDVRGFSEIAGNTPDGLVILSPVEISP